MAPVTYEQLPDVHHFGDGSKFIRTILPHRFASKGRAGWIETTGPYRKFDLYLNRGAGQTLSLYEPAEDRCWTREQDDLPIMEQVHLVTLVATNWGPDA
jgi:hypothetical protein